jgi:tubulin-specific chaperone E
MSTSFRNLKDLQLNHTLTSWQEMQFITSLMPALKVVELGYNQLSQLEPASPEALAPLEVLNLDSNLCADFEHICDAARPYTLWVQPCSARHHSY